MMENMNRAERNMQFVRDALKAEGQAYTMNGETMEFIRPVSMELKDKRLRIFPTYINVRVHARDDGIMAIGAASVRLPELEVCSEEEILAILAKENFGNIQNGMVYDPERREVFGRLFVPVGDTTDSMTPEFLMASFEMLCISMTKGYAQILAHYYKKKPEKKAKSMPEGDLLKELQEMLDMLGEEEDAG